MIIWEETSFSHSVPKRLHTRPLFPCNINFVQQALFCNLIYGDNEKGSKDIIWDILSNMGNNITILGSADFSPTIHTDHLDIPSREQSAFHIIGLDSFKYHELSLTSENIDWKLDGVLLIICGCSHVPAIHTYIVRTLLINSTRKVHRLFLRGPREAFYCEDVSVSMEAR